jgi:hypothetical protein
LDSRQGVIVHDQAVLEDQQGQAELLDGVEVLHPQQLLLEG